MDMVLVRQKRDRRDDGHGLQSLFGYIFNAYITRSVKSVLLLIARHCTRLVLGGVRYVCTIRDTRFGLCGRDERVVFGILASWDFGVSQPLVERECTSNSCYNIYTESSAYFFYDLCDQREPCAVM